MPASDSCGRQTAKVRQMIAGNARSYGVLPGIAVAALDRGHGPLLQRITGHCCCSS